MIATYVRIFSDIFKNNHISLPILFGWPWFNLKAKAAVQEEAQPAAAAGEAPSAQSAPATGESGTSGLDREYLRQVWTAFTNLTATPRSAHHSSATVPPADYHKEMCEALWRAYFLNPHGPDAYPADRGAIEAALKAHEPAAEGIPSEHRRSEAET